MGEHRRRPGRSWGPLQGNLKEQHDLAQWLRDVVTGGGMSIREIAARMPYSKDAISRSLRGDCRPEWLFVRDLLSACTPGDAKALDTLLRRAKPLWESADPRTATKISPAVGQRNDGSALQIQEIVEALQRAEANRYESQLAVSKHQQIISALMFMLGRVIGIAEQLDAERHRLREQVIAEQSARSVLEDTLCGLQDVEHRLVAAEEKREQAEGQLKEARKQLGRAERLHFRATLQEIQARRRLERANIPHGAQADQSGAIGSRSDLMGDVDQQVADMVLDHVRSFLERSAESLDRLDDELDERDRESEPDDLRVPLKTLSMNEVGLGTGPQQVDIQLSGALLAALREISIKPWECLAELIDNSLEAFADQSGATVNGERPTVAISLPGRRETGEEDLAIVVRDNSTGMDLGTLENSVRVGWAVFGKFGLSSMLSTPAYGLGFNVAIKNLGNEVTVKTSRAQDPSWTVLTLNISKIIRGEGFAGMISYEQKDRPDAHGTKIIISDLNPNQRHVFSRQEAKIRDQLGDVYGYLLRERDFLITVNGKKVQPRRPCLWDASRTVTRSGVEINAVLEIDRRLPVMKACLDCGWWNPLSSRECQRCGDAHLHERERRIWGWLGVQRYIHKNDYGIDFLRNGRKVLIRDKQVFFWADAEGIDEPDLEYPIDDPARRGRIVGEIHCDHVPVNYQKNAFVFDSIDWQTVVQTIRGDSPLRVSVARRHGMPINQSPLARLFMGFRRADPGLNSLIPGDGKQALHEKTIEWAKEFRSGHPNYQTDQIWYDSAREHDRIKGLGD